MCSNKYSSNAVSPITVERAPLFYLPWSPSVNKIWRSYRNKVCLSKEYQEFLDSCQLAYLHQGAPKLLERPNEELDVRLYFFPPYRRSYDVDNRIKPVLDALTKVGFWSDDSIVRRISAIKCAPCKSGATVIEIYYIEARMLPPETFGLLPLKPEKKIENAYNPI